MENLSKCNAAVNNTYNYVRDTLSDISFVTVPTHFLQTSFRIVTRSGVKMSIGHSPDTGGELETILLDANDDLLDDTLEYHENLDNLVKYIEDLTTIPPSE